MSWIVWHGFWLCILFCVYNYWKFDKRTFPLQFLVRYCVRFEYHRYQRKKAEMKGKVLGYWNILPFLFYTVTTLSSKKCNMSSWTVDKLVTAQVILSFCYKSGLFYFTLPPCLKIFHLNPKIKQRSCRKAKSAFATLIQCICSYLLLWPSTVKQNQPLVKNILIFSTLM